jgi:cytochrome c-type biogenesis protein CcmH/NrfG
LAAVGLSCPAHWTLTRFFDLLVAERVLSTVAAREYLAAHYEAQYGFAAVDGARANAVVEAVLRELDRAAASDLGRVATTLAPAPAPPVTETAESLDVGSESGREDFAPQRTAPGPPEVEPESEAPRWSWRESPVQRRLALAGALVLWSLLMLGLGSSGRPLLTGVWKDLQVGVLKAPQPISPEERLRAARDRAARHPGVVEAWLTYANRAEDQRRSSEAVLALRHLVARFPQDPELLNNLAWLYCTAAEPAARDPVQALDLAERAHTLSQAPHITDTLAEAAFQNGDVERAIGLEEDALRRAGDNQEFYRRQLVKFKAAAEGR